MKIWIAVAEQRTPAEVLTMATLVQWYIFNIWMMKTPTASWVKPNLVSNLLPLFWSAVIPPASVVITGIFQRLSRPRICSMDAVQAGPRNTEQPLRLFWRCSSTAAGETIRYLLSQKYNWQLADMPVRQTTKLIKLITEVSQLIHAD